MLNYCIFENVINGCFVCVINSVLCHLLSPFTISTDRDVAVGVKASSLSLVLKNQTRISNMFFFFFLSTSFLCCGFSN